MNRPADDSSNATRAAPRPRSVRIRSGSRGSAARVCATTNAASRTPDATRGPTVPGADHPATSAREVPYTRLNSPRVTVVAPSRSTRRPTRRSDAGASTTAPTTAGIATAMLTNIVHRHENAWVSAPPRSRPAVVPTMATEPKIPNARPRSAGSVKVVDTRASAAGASRAAKTP